MRTPYIHSGKTEVLLLCLGLAFNWLVAISLWLQSGVTLDILAMLELSLLSLFMHFWLQRHAPQRDPIILPATITLTGWGLQIITRVAVNFLSRQMTWIAIAFLIFAAITATKDRLRWLRRYKYTWLLVSLLLLAATLVLGVNPTGEGARRWLSVAGIFVQPSETLRLLMLAFLASFLSERINITPWLRRLGFHRQNAPGENPHMVIILRHRLNLRSITRLAPAILIWVIAVALLVTQQDLGAAALVLITYAFMIYLATGEFSIPVIGSLALLIAGAVGYRFSTLIALRINIWLNPWLDAQGTSFQTVQSLIAMASGGIFGQGPGQGRPIYIPAVHTDFPFAAIGEEYGLIGALGLLLVFAVLSLRAWNLARSTPSSYALLLSGGIGVFFTTQVFVIVGGNLGILPLTGVTLPMVSYGGSSLVVSYIASALLLRISCDYTQVHVDPQLVASASKILPGSASEHVLRATSSQYSAAHRSMLICATLFIAAMLTAGYWCVIQSMSLKIRSDNPRNVDTEKSIQRGSILARDGSVLAVSKLQSTANPYSPPVYNRAYLHIATAALTGYYSLEHGVGGLEAYADDELRGHSTYLDNILHRTQSGNPITTTIDLEIQQRLSVAMSTTTGAAVVMDWHTGEILALISAPIYDPNTLDAQWDTLRNRADAPLLNRATQGLYQPGNLLGWIYGQTPNTDAEHNVLVWDPEDRFELGKPVQFELANAATPYPITATYSETIGQGNLRLTPLRVAVTAAALTAGKALTPTVIRSDIQKSADSQSDYPIRQVVFTAQTADNKYIGWLIRTGSQQITVLAIESTSSSTARLQQVLSHLATP